jgi:hypothetical protein
MRNNQIKMLEIVGAFFFNITVNAKRDRRMNRGHFCHGLESVNKLHFNSKHAFTLD